MKIIISKPIVSVLYCPGTNCEEETMQAFKLAGARPKLVFLNDIASGKVSIMDCDIFCVPGGFSFGDYVGTGVIAAMLLEDKLPLLIDHRIPTIGICNGFQILTRAKFFGECLTLAQNVCRTFRAIPVLHRVERSDCAWTRKLNGRKLSFPSAHGYGRVYGNVLHDRIAMTYSSTSPNGGEIAALSSDNGLVFGVMDHPERPYGNEDGLLIFRNGVEAVR